MAVEGTLPERRSSAEEPSIPLGVNDGALPSFVRMGTRSVAVVDAGEYRALKALVEAIGNPERAQAACATVAAGISETDPIRPVFAQISGIDLVTIPRKHYAELLDCRRLVTEAGIEKWQYRGDPRSRIERDPEVATFLTEHMGQRLLREVHALCSERFGAERTPGTSTIYRFWRRLGKQ